MIKSLIPQRVRKTLRDLLGITELHERIDRLYELILETKEDSKDIWERSRIRWRESEPTTALTWGREITGDNFISKVSSYEVFNSEKTILEVGAGYGRLLRSCLEQKIPFKKYIAIDISIENVDYLRENFPKRNIHIMHGDVEEISSIPNYDVMLSSLTFKHLFPSFEKALRNVVNYANPDSMFFFDLIEGKNKHFSSTYTYIRQYTRSEIVEILSIVSLELVAFDQVQHGRDYSRLLVVARKPK